MMKTLLAITFVPKSTRHDVRVSHSSPATSLPNKAILASAKACQGGILSAAAALTPDLCVPLLCACRVTKSSMRCVYCRVHLAQVYDRMMVSLLPLLFSQEGRSALFWQLSFISQPARS